MVADVTLYNAWVGRVSYQFTVPPKYALLEPTDVITVTKDGAAYLVRLTATKLVRNGMQEISGVAEDVSSYDFYNPAGTGTPNLQPPATISATRLELMDLPAFPTDAVTDAYLRYGVVGLGENWAGSAVYRSDDGGSNYALTVNAEAAFNSSFTLFWGFASSCAPCDIAPISCPAWPFDSLYAGAETASNKADTVVSNLCFMF